MVKVSVSSLPAEKNLLSYVKQIEKFADFLHCDFMDGTITNEKTLLDENLVKAINENSTLPLDVHIMSNNPKKYIENFKHSGANIISVQYEVFENKSQIKNCLQLIKDRKTLCGLAVDLKTNIHDILNLLNLVDVVIIMSVNLGKYGQSFDISALSKIEILNNYRKKNNLNFKISVDGGINDTNCDKLKQMGVDILVSGGYIFNETNYQQAIDKIKN